MQCRIIRQPLRHQDLHAFQRGSVQLLQSPAVQGSSILRCRLDGLLGNQLPVALAQKAHCRRDQPGGLPGVCPQHGAVGGGSCSLCQRLPQGEVGILGMGRIEDQPVGKAFIG